MSGISEYEEMNCPKGRKDLKTGKVMKIALFRDGCNKTESCKFICEHKKK